MLMVSAVYASGIKLIIPRGSVQPLEMKGQSFNNGAGSPSSDTQGHQWFDVAYDASDWGVMSTPMNTIPENTHYYLIATFNVEDIQSGSYCFYCKHDDGIEIYINGKLIASNSTHTNEQFNLYNIPMDCLEKGENKLAVHVWNGGGPGYLDFELIYTSGMDTVIPRGSNQPFDMKYSASAPTADSQGVLWTESAFDDSTWETITIPINSMPENKHYYLRRKFVVENSPNGLYLLNCKHDDGIEVYINGNLLVTNSQYSNYNYNSYNIPSTYLLDGENWLSVHAWNDGGEGYFDCEIVHTTAIDFDSPSYECYVNQAVDCRLLYDPQIPNLSYVLKSSDESVAIVTGSGKVIGMSEGTAIIQATSSDGSAVYAECEINVLASENDDSGSYNKYLSAYTTGASIISIGGYVRKTLGYSLSNNGSECIYITQLICKNANNYSIVASTTDENLLGWLANGETKSYSIQLTSDINLVYEVHYIYNGKEYVYYSDHNDPLYHPELDGDVNDDGMVDINDVVAVINHMAGSANWRFANVNSDGDVDINDVVAIINIMAGHLPEKE